MKRNYWFLIVFVFTLFASTLASASSPVDMLQQTSDQMLSALKQTHNRNTTVLYGIIERILLPHVDLDTMAVSVVGRNYWRSASPDQQRNFKKEFTHFVTQTYSSALASYTDEKIKFYPIRGGVTGKRIQVNSDIIQTSGQNIAVSYQLIEAGGQWKIYDFSVEGISLVVNYRAQFEKVLASEGFEGLLKRLREHNESRA